MEGNVLDIFRVLSGVVVWAIPAILVLAVVVFVVAAPAAALAGAVLHLYEGVRNKLRRRVPAEMEDLNLVCAVDAECPPGFVCVKGHCVPEKEPEKELVGTKS